MYKTRLEATIDTWLFHHQSIKTMYNLDKSQVLQNFLYPSGELAIYSIDVFPIIFDARGLRPDLLRFPCVCVMTFRLGL